MKECERYILTTGKASVIRDALSLVLAGVNSEGNLIPGTRKRPETFIGKQCDRLILDLRTAEGLPSAISQRVRNLRVSHLGRVLVVTGDVATPGILREIEALSHPHFFPKYAVSGLLALVSMLF